MFANLTLPWNRIVVLGFVLMVLFFTWLVLNKTRLGLNVRAVTQTAAWLPVAGCRPDVSICWRLVWAPALPV
ncbi:branched-chain amino acid transport system permease [Enterobacter cloacae]|uniref:Branched-chain amino acid transport system permease n=1 Tax=Enterobacter cloacae TaxID=550 RepID=A0A377M0U3_ENTCL|nr:branched-chain amino acid transport system permease [Enterobacter cloacae]